MNATLAQAWESLAAKAGWGGGPTGVFQELSQCYSEPHRAYHNLHHLENVLQELAMQTGSMDQPVDVALALWFHDVIYDPRATDNEAQSARWFAERARTAGLPESLVTRVEQLIMATSHKAPPTDESMALLVDIDLGILGAVPDVFDEYERQIRREYSWVPEAAFRSGRSAVLRLFLERPRIYYTGALGRKYEQAARENINRSPCFL